MSAASWMYILLAIDSHGLFLFSCCLLIASKEVKCLRGISKAEPRSAEDQGGTWSFKSSKINTSFLSSTHKQEEIRLSGSNLLSKKIQIILFVNNWHIFLFFNAYFTRSQDVIYLSCFMYVCVLFSLQCFKGFCRKKHQPQHVLYFCKVSKSFYHCLQHICSFEPQQWFPILSNSEWHTLLSKM